MNENRDNYPNKVKTSERGQVLIIGIITVLILVIAIIFLYDLHSVIRVKVKTQTAADAAALTAANWQRHSLNLIGELNLVKACTVLVSDIVPFGDDSVAGITTSSEILSEMQARISFVGPMIGFGAAQQAAKNNGMYPVDHFSTVVQDHLDNLDPNNRDYYSADNGIRQGIENYSWKQGYIQMIEAVKDGQGGIAAAPNVDFASIPRVDPDWLLHVGLYRAIAAEYWCHPDLLDKVKTPGQLKGTWWLVDIVKNSSSFPEECEYSPIYIQYSGVIDKPYVVQAKNSLDTMATDRDLTVFDKYEIDDPNDIDKINTSQPLQYVRWCIYDSRWASDLPDSEWIGTGPVSYLRSPLMPEYIYGGALAKMLCYANPTVMSSNYKAGKLSGNWLSASSASVAPVTCTALAKPLGRLASGIPPYAASMVLPVFDKTRLIPVAMQDPTGLYNPFDQEQYNLFKFLEWLKDNSIDIGELEPPAFAFKPIEGCPNDTYLWDLQKLNTPSWRAKGYNPDYPKDPDAQPGWLQVKRTYTKIDKDGNSYTFIDTNEYSCTDWGDRPGPGNHDGPPKLH